MATNSYPLSLIKDLIRNKSYQINLNARETARNEFDWGTSEILDALLRLRPGHFYKSAPHMTKPGVAVDTYKARINGEDVYTHFYVTGARPLLVVSSFKRI